MQTHEYQAIALLRKYSAPVRDGRVVLLAKDAKTAAGQTGGLVWVFKAHIHANFQVEQDVLLYFIDLVANQN